MSRRQRVRVCIVCVRQIVFWPALVVLGPSNPIGRPLVERDPSVTPSTLSVQLAYQSNFLMLPSPEGDQHSMKLKAAFHLFYL